jgi:hypothetical protein
VTCITVFTNSDVEPHSWVRVTHVTWRCQGTAQIYPSAMPSPSITVTPAGPQKPTKSGYHVHRRWFLGPMPDKWLSGTGKQAKSTSADDESVSQIITDNAFHFFIHSGGQKEDWGENAEMGVKEEMMRRWSDTEWGRIWRKKLEGKEKENKESKRWIGASFEVGEFLGVNILDEGRTISLKTKRSTQSTASDAASSLAPLATFPDTIHSNNSDIFTKESLEPNSIRNFHLPQPPTSPDDPFSAGPSDPVPTLGTFVLPKIVSSENLKNAATSLAPERTLPPNHDDVASSTIGLLGPPLTPKKISTELLRPIFRSPSSPGMMSDDDTPASKNKGKAKLVYFAPPSTPGPAPASEVLERTGSEVDVTSAGAAVDSSPQGEEIQWGEVVMRGMLLESLQFH